MFFVDLRRCCDVHSHPVTISPEQYLVELAQSIVRSAPDVEVHAWLVRLRGDAMVFGSRWTAPVDDDNTRS